MPSATSMVTPPERYASISDALISAAIYGMFRFTESEQAKTRIEAIQNAFVTSRFSPDAKEDKATEGVPAIRLWIRGFDVSEEEETQGFLGHYADIMAASLAKGKYTLIARKVALPLKNHPHKRTPTRSHPNWGHPVLRILKNKQRRFKTPEEALEVLMRLHEEFPDVTIPNPTKLYAMVYNRKLKPPVQKYVFEIKTHKEGGFFIDYRVNMPTAKKPATNKPKPSINENTKTAVDKEEVTGYFTSKVALERTKKKRKIPVKKATSSKAKKTTD